jgi:hypothetical protein
MVLAQQISKDEALIQARLPAANDNYQQPTLHMKSFEAGSILSRLDYTQPRKRNRIGLIVTAIFCVFALAVFAYRLAI